MKVNSFVKKTVDKYDAHFEQIEVPRVGNKEVLVQVSAVGLCGSDLHIYAGHPGYHWIDFPLVLGHEVTGRVVKVGTSCDDNLIGEKVVINPYIACGKCNHCQVGNINRCEFGGFSKEKKPSKALQYGFRKPGGLAEYIKVRQDNVIIIEESVPDTVAAISEGIAVSYTGLAKIDNFKHKRILVVGPGPIGLGVVAILAGYKNENVEVLGTQYDSDRLYLAKIIGAKQVYEDWQEIKENSNKSYDAIIDCSGHYSVPEESLKWVDRGADIVLLGISEDKFTLPMDQIVRGEINIKGSYGITVGNYKEVLKLAEDKSFPFKQIISEEIPFSDIKTGFNKALGKAPGKIVIKM
ncbi:zinc-dependent alcohol dehydrogenase [Pseudogracilibacillus sp. SO30301A]|uniref:zinc-dependent alcohol dehydrogenase n=1 Tax=Pseudogracilibacillus sp. SO30301A TaxID=3098291 RepID=UPI00300E1C80